MNQQKQKGRFGKVYWFAGGILVLFAGLVGAWYYAAGLLESQLADISDAVRNGGGSFRCEESSVRGFPFRIGLFCNNVLYNDPSQEMRVSTGALRSAAQLYRPGHVVAEVDSPAGIRLPMLAPLRLDWKSLRTSTNLSTSGLNRVSLEVASLDVSADDAGFLSLLGRIGKLEAHARQAPARGDDDLQFALSADDWQIGDPKMTPVVPVDLNFAVIVEDLLPVFLNGGDPLPIIRQRGGSAIIEEMVFETADGGRIAVSGPLSVTPQGSLSGLLQIDLENPKDLTRFVEQVFPPAADRMRDMQVYFEALGSGAGGKTQIKGLTLSIRDGDVFAGFFKVAEIPRLF